MLKFLVFRGAICEPDRFQHSLCRNQANHGQYLMVLLCGLTNETTL